MRVLLYILVACLLPVQCFAEEINMQVIIYPPLAYEVDGELKGVAPDVVRAIQAEVGDTNKIYAAPWLRAYEQTQTQERQALFAIVRIPKRENLFKWVGPIFEEGDYFFKKKGTKLEVRSLREAKSVNRIAVRKDGYTHQALEEAGFKNLDISPTYDSSYKKIAEGRVDLVLLGERTYYYMVRKAGLDHTLFEKTQCKFADSGAWLAFSKDIPDETIMKWQQALDTLKENGMFDQIMERNFRH